MAEMILLKLFYVLICPGFLFCSVAGLLLAGVDRKVVARMQKRIGPPILQPMYDFLKLMGKETITPRQAAKKAYLAAPVIGFVSLIVLALIIPVFGFSVFPGIADLIVILYLLTIPAVAIIMGGAASGSTFASIGISRGMVAIISYELPLITVFLTVAKKVGLATGAGMTFSMAAITQFQAAYGMIITKWSMIPAALAMLLVIPCQVGCHPFDVAEAETEICDGPLVEYSGTPLAIYKLSHAIKVFISTALFVALFLGGAGTGILVVDALLLFFICAGVTILCMTLIRAVTARLKVEQVLRFYWKVVTGLALISLILVWLGL